MQGWTQQPSDQCDKKNPKMLRNFGSIRAQAVLALPTSIPIEIKVELITRKEKRIIFSKSDC